MPSIFNRDATKVITSLKVDEQRNILYCLKEEQEGKCAGHSEISVFDLGMLGDQFNKVSSISLIDIMRRIDEYMGRTEVRYENKYESALFYRV